MGDIHHWGLFVMAGLLLNLTPGPDVMFIVTQTLKGGLRHGLAAAAGIGAGCLVHVAAAAAGLSALMATSATAFAVLKLLGAAYLVYVGMSLILQSGHRTEKTIANNDLFAMGTGRKEAAKVFLSGFWTNALNPKVALFFLAFVPQFISPTPAHPAIAFLLLGLVFTANSLWVNAAWAVAASAAVTRIGVLGRAMGLLQRLSGALLVAFGFRLALSDNPAL